MNINRNVFVVDDDEITRNLLCIALKNAGYSVATFSSAAEFLAFFNAQTEGCIILDVNMPVMDGPSLQDELNRRGSSLPIIFLTAHGSIPMSVRSIKAGATDFLTKPVDCVKLLACVKDALEKFSQTQQQTQDIQAITARLALLTEREKEIMTWVIEGFTSKETAERLNISYRTVENYRANIMHKTGCTNIIELARIASHLKN
jgi:FixJ family two-component response regulator